MDGSGATILLVDDELFFAARILSVLRKQGYHADQAPSAEEAVRRMQERRPDLVILNLGSPRLGGIPLVRRLKETGAPRVLAFINHTRIPEVRDEALAAGVDQLCANSAVTARLPDLVTRALRGGHSEAQVIED